MGSLRLTLAMCIMISCLPPVDYTKLGVPASQRVAEAAVRPDGVAVEPPFGQRRPGMGERGEQGLVQRHYHHSAEGHTDISLRNSHDLIRYGFNALREAEYAAGRS